VDVLAVGSNAHAVAVFPEHAVLRVQAFERVVLLGRPVEVAEEALEDVRHQIPRGAGVEPKPVALEHAGVAAESVVAFEQAHVGAGVGQIRRRCEPAEPAADDRHSLVRVAHV
jgi:hypothetical protein